MHLCKTLVHKDSTMGTSLYQNPVEEKVNVGFILNYHQQ